MVQVVKPSYEILAVSGHKEFPYSYEQINLLMEACGRTCYKSEDKITYGSANVFVQGCENRKHYTITEHSWFVREYVKGVQPLGVGNWNKYLNVSNDGMHLSGSKRAFAEASVLNPKLFSDYFFLFDSQVRDVALRLNDPTVMAATVRFVVDRGVSHELVRHRPCTFSQESTRYVNYLDRGMQVILPPWCDETEIRERISAEMWEESMSHLESVYGALLKMGWRAEMARAVLPQSVKTEICVTASLSEWQHIFGQRALDLTGRAHPQMREVMVPLWEEFKVLEPTFFEKDVIEKTFN